MKENGPHMACKYTMKILPLLVNFLNNAITFPTKCGEADLL